MHYVCLVRKSIESKRKKEKKLLTLRTGAVGKEPLRVGVGTSPGNETLRVRLCTSNDLFLTLKILSPPIFKVNGKKEGRKKKKKIKAMVKASVIYTNRKLRSDATEKWNEI